MKSQNTSSLKTVSSAYMIYTVIAVISLIFPFGSLADLFLKLGANSICVAIATMGFSTIEIHILLSAFWFAVFSISLIATYIILIVKLYCLPFFITICADAVVMAIWTVANAINNGVDGSAFFVSLAIRVLYLIYFYNIFMKPCSATE